MVMTLIEGAVLAASAAAIGWINWYFFVAGRRATHVTAGQAGQQDVVVRVDGGYEPSAIQVVAGRPVRLSFDRVDTSGCSEEVTLPDFGIRRFLPTGARTTVEFTPERPGTYTFTCGMGMLRGRLVVTRATVV
jgi:plastocyanin domain-containing protein